MEGVADTERRRAREERGEGVVDRISGFVDDCRG